MIFLTLLLIPALVALGFLIFSGRLVTLKEFFVHVAVLLVFAGICTFVIYWRNTADVERINGVVTAKKSERVSCRHPYCCRWCESCTTDSKGHRSCTTYCCSTCYDHDFDIDWNVYSNVQQMWSIDTIDRQGLREPPRWTQTRIGEPVTWLHGYENYIKAAPGTLFKRTTRDDEKRFPLLPERVEVYDYWRTDQLYQVGLDVPERTSWNRAIAEVNGRVGPTVQANVAVVLVKGQPREYFEALQAKWLGGKKNDVVVVIGVDDEMRPQWADVMAWSYNEMVRVALRDEIMSMERIDRQSLLTLVERNVVQHFKRKSMKDFKYLQASFAPTGLQYLVSILIGTLISVGLGIFFMINDVFDEEGEQTWRSARVGRSRSARSVWR